MQLLLSVVVVFGLAVVVVLGTLSVGRDLLALTKHRPPSVSTNCVKMIRNQRIGIAEVHHLTPSMHRRAARLPRMSMQLIDLLKRKNTP